MTNLTPSKTRNLSPAKVLLLPLTFTVTMLVAIGWYISGSSQTAKKLQLADSRIQDLSGEIIYMDEVLTMSARMAAATGDLRWDKRYHSFAPKLDAAFDEATRLLPTLFKSDAMNKANAANTKLVEMEERAFKLTRQKNLKAAADLLSSPEYSQQKAIYSKGVKETIQAMKKYVEASLNFQAAQANIAVMSLAVVMLLLAIAWGYYVQTLIRYNLNRVLKNIVGVIKQISQGDLTAQVEVTSNNSDEIRELMVACQTMTQNLNSLILQVQQTGIQITNSATGITVFGNQLEAMTTEQVASTHQVVATTQEIAATSQELVNTMEYVAAMAQSTTTFAQSNQTELISMEATIRGLASATHSISSKLGAIAEKANNINNVIVTITKVADQTNLLSLNAAIEAEKAGEYGLGFAVVAREIRRLADQTAVSTLDIESMIQEMQAAVSTGVMEMDKFSTEVNRSVETIHNISMKLTQVIEQVQALPPQFNMVNQGMEAQSQGAKQISEAMSQLSEASRQTNSSLHKTNNALAQLQDTAQNLRREISHFKMAT